MDSRTVLRAIVPTFACVAMLLGFKYWLSEAGRTPAQWEPFYDALLQMITTPKELLNALVDHVSFVIVNMGLFLLPIVLLLLGNQSVNRGRRARVVVAIVSLSLVSLVGLRVYFGASIILPIHDNVLVKSGIGPTMLRDTFILMLDNIRGLPFGFWITVSAVASVGAIALLTELCLRAWSAVAKVLNRRAVDFSESTGIFLLLCCLCYVTILLPSPFMFDRYITPMIPLLVVGMACISGTREEFLGIVKPVRASAFAILAVFSVYAIVGTRDYLTWNRVRWKALQSLMTEHHVDPREIDGGFEFNGLYLFGQNLKGERSRNSWWWVERDTYQIAFGPVSGYSVFKEYTYFHWLPPHVQRVVVLKKDNT